MVTFLLLQQPAGSPVEPRDGFMKRRVYAEVPPRVDYDLTAVGRAFFERVRPSEVAGESS
jgi:DNA-binding HxlR family transcriptional regulator